MGIDIYFDSVDQDGNSLKHGDVEWGVVIHLFREGDRKSITKFTKKKLDFDFIDKASEDPSLKTFFEPRQIRETLKILLMCLQEHFDGIVDGLYIKRDLYDQYVKNLSEMIEVCNFAIDNGCKIQVMIA
jgi:hypothetical protein